MRDLSFKRPPGMLRGMWSDQERRQYVFQLVESDLNDLRAGDLRNLQDDTLLFLGWPKSRRKAISAEVLSDLHDVSAVMLKDVVASKEGGRIDVYGHAFREEAETAAEHTSLPAKVGWPLFLSDKGKVEGEYDQYG